MNRDELILSNLDLARKIGLGYAKRKRRSADDMVAAANYGLVQAAQWISEGRCTDPRYVMGYIVETIKRFCREDVEKDHTIVIDHRAKQRMYKEGLTDYGTEQSPDARLLWEEELEQLNPRHRRIVELRVAGYNGLEIAAQLGVSHQMITKNMKELRHD